MAKFGLGSELRVTIEGQTDLLMHADRVTWADMIKAWLAVPANAKASGVKGDDRSPAFTWVGYMWTEREDGGNVVIPAEVMLAALSSAGAGLKSNTSRFAKSLKSEACSSIVVRNDAPLLVAGKPVDSTPFYALADEGELDFNVYVKAAIKAGFILDVRRAAVGANKHVRVRPRFSRWSAVFDLLLTSDNLTLGQIEDLFKMAGSSKGLGDWRPGSPKKPGTHGMFKLANVEVI